MSVSGGGNLYPNWLGSASLTIPNNQVVVNGTYVNVVPFVTTTNQSIASITKNTTTLLYQTPISLPPGKYLVGGETQSGSTGTAWGTSDVVDWVIVGIGDTAPDYAETTIKPYYNAVTFASGGSPVGTGIIKFDLAGITELTTTTPLGVYLTYYTPGSGTIATPFSLANFFYQKVA